MTSDQSDRRRGGRGRYIRSLSTAEVDAEACKLRAQGLTLQEVADRLSLGGREQARRAIGRALAAVVREPAEELRALELERLDELTRRAWQVMTSVHLVTSASGRVVEDPRTGQPLVDDGPVLAAIDRLVRIGESRRKLLGTDAPTRAAVTVETNTDYDREIALLIQQVAGIRPGPDGAPMWHPESPEVRGQDS